MNGSNAYVGLGSRTKAAAVKTLCLASAEHPEALQQLAEKFLLGRLFFESQGIGSLKKTGLIQLL